MTPLTAAGFYSLYVLAEALQVCCFTGVRISRALMLRLVPARDEQKELWFIPDPCKRLAGPPFYTIADKSLLRYHIQHKSPPLIPKIEQDILLHPNTLELVCETQFLSVVQRLHELIETEEICLLSDHLPRTNENTCIDLVLNLCFQREQLDYYCSSCLSNICQERNIYYRQLLFSATRLDKALEYLCIENTCLQKWKQKSLPISIGCFRSCKSCELLAEIEKWQHFETKHTSTRDKMFIGNS